MAMRRALRVVQRRRSKTLRCSRAKNDSIAAWSPAEPTWPIEPTSPWRARVRCTFLARNWDPRSVCKVQPATSPRRVTAISSAATTSRGFMRSSIAQPTMRFENRSLMAQRCSLPSALRCSIRLELAVADRLCDPPVVLGTAQLEDPTRHRDGDPVAGKVTDEREHHLPGRLDWDR
jgi:hypothetical protein